MAVLFTRCALFRPVFGFRSAILYSSTPKLSLLPDEKDFKSSSPPPTPSVYIDTHQLVTSLTSVGFTLPQSEAIVNMLRTNMDSVLASFTSEHVKRYELDLLSMRLTGEIQSVKSSVVLIEKSVVDSLRKDNEGLKGQVEKLKSRLKDEVSKVQAGLQLDLNLEKSRIKEDATGLVQLIKDTNNTIDKEVAMLKTQIESQKLESIKYLAGGIFSMITLMLSVVLGLWRLLGK